MRTASTTLTAAMTAMNKGPIWKVVMSRSAASTRAYDNTRVIKISHAETPSGDACELVFNNSDGALTSLNFEHYQVVISYGYNTGISRSAWVAGSVYAVDDMVIPTAANTNGYQYRCSVAGTVAGTTEPTWSTTLGITITDSAVTWETDGTVGQEYSRVAPLRNRVQEMHSGMGLLKCIIRPKGIFDQLKEDEAISELTYTSSETATVQSLITAVAGTTMAAYSTYTAYTVTYDSTDGIISNFKPADYFAIRMNDNRLSKVQELLDYTGCKMRINNDGQIHIFDPVTSGTTYNYEYKFNVSGSHNFWNEHVRLRFVDPNYVIVMSHPDHSPTYLGTATSATSYALAPKTHTISRRLPSNSIASSIAAAMIEGYELDAEIGFATVPMNPTQELWDYVKLTDSRMGGTTRIGNIQFIQRDVEVHSNNQPLTWKMMFSFGKVTAQSLLMAELYAGGSAGAGGTLSTEMQIAMYNEIIDKLKGIINAHNQLRIEFDELREQGVFQKGHFIQQLVIPVI